MLSARNTEVIMGSHSRKDVKYSTTNICMTGQIYHERYVERKKDDAKMIYHTTFKHKI